MRRPLRPALLLLAISTITACDEANRLRAKIEEFKNPEQAYVAVPGDPAQTALEPVGGGAAVSSDTALEALAVAQNEKAAASLRARGLVAEEAGKPASVSPAAAALLAGNQKAKDDFASTGFQRDDPKYFARSVQQPFTLAPQALTASAVMIADTVNWTATGKDSFTISTLSKMPVRDQGPRGTCAAFAGAGHLEGFLLKKYPTLAAIDLSEQRFYYAAKPEHWVSGGSPESQGSDSGSGFASSGGYDWKEYDSSYNYPADWPAQPALNLPLEADCPYVKQVGATDVQIPQAAGCASGAVKVLDYAAWNFKFDNRLRTAQQIYDYLLSNDVPVIVGTKLSSNWEDNDGMITLAEAGQPSDSIHAAGHAYLIVGARKLNEAEFPGEGGLCFVVKNSWGKGWGVNGLACMTLAWFNTWRFADDASPFALDVEVDDENLASAATAAGTVPPSAKEPDPASKKSDDSTPFGTLKKKRGEARVDRFADVDLAALQALTQADFTVGRLIAADDQAYKMLFRVDGEQVTLRGVLKGQTQLTNDLTFALADGAIVRDVPGRGVVAFGELDVVAKQVTLCSRAYAPVCDLNYVSDWNELVAGLTEAAAKTEDSVEPFNWSGVDLAGYGIEFSLPEGRGSRVDVRFRLADVYTNPQRFAVDLIGGAVNWRGRAIGNYQSFEMCTGDFAALCRVVVAGDTFQVLFKAQKK